MSKAREITRLIQAASAGDQRANNELFESVYQELRSIARAHRRRWNGNDTLNTNVLINEAYIKLASGKLASYDDRIHFFATASRAMRQVLINYAERVSASKRGMGAIRVTLSGNMPITEDTLDDLLTINELLVKLEKMNARQCRLFECRVFGGMTIEETATALGISAATVKRDWSIVSAWVYRELQEVKASLPLQP